MAGWHHREPSPDAGETYGQHSQAHAHLPVAVLLQQVVAEGEAIRLAWPAEGNGHATEAGEWPTAVLPRVPKAAVSQNA